MAPQSLDFYSKWPLNFRLLSHLSLYLNCRGNGGEASLHRNLSAGLWEEKVTVFGRKNRLNFRFRPEIAIRRPFFFFFLEITCLNF